MEKKVLTTGIIWSIISFGVMGLCGLSINFLIARTYGPSALGVFNQSFAAFTILGILANFGVSLSVLHFISVNAENRGKVGGILASSTLLTALTGAVAVGAAYLFKPVYHYFIGSEQATLGYLFIVPAIFFYSQNKTMLDAINALSKIKDFALLQSLRYVAILSFLVWLILRRVDESGLVLCVLYGEMTTYIFLLAYFGKLWTAGSLKEIRSWIPRHLSFGVKGLMGDMALSLNAYVDVLMLGCILPDVQVGIYSLASQMVDGLNELFKFFRYPITPYLGSEFASGRVEKLCRWVRSYVRKVYVAGFFICLLAAALFSPVVLRLVGNDAFEASKYPFYILLVGIFLGSGYRPIGLLLSQIGLPGKQTMMRLCIVGINVALNLVLIPSMGLLGAAAATTLSMFVGALLIRYIVRKATGFAI
ncbi:MAG: oligosaccharide flippase family protein [Pseudodesulfovibrio sp.]